jgi:hypothetical protein
MRVVVRMTSDEATEKADEEDAIAAVNEDRL